ncbi:hypothetical protein F4808DRAFT_418427 [Astrocystis sublimbata]|nr:hypothetical protein F4808DRAFT_418427 [Astrocystis sublimbata]
MRAPFVVLRGISTAAAMATKPIPIILIGASQEVGRKVTESFKSHFEVIQFMDSFPKAQENLPSILAGKGPKTPSDNDIGTHDYSKTPRAVIFGRRYNQEQVKELNGLCSGTESAPVAWITGDPAVEPPAQPGPDYASKTAGLVMDAFKKWENAGGKSDILLY